MKAIEIVWVAGLLLIGLIGQPAWTGWLIILAVIFCIAPQFWRWLESRGLRSFASGRRGFAMVCTVFLGFAAFFGLQTRAQFEETENVLHESDLLLTQLEEEYPSENHDFRWEYRTHADPMSDRSVEIACIKSSNAVRLSPPYENTRAELCLRDDPDGKSAFVALLKGGQVLCRSYQGCAVRARFDDEQPKSYDAVEPSDGSTNLFFIMDASGFEKRINGAKVLNLEAEFYQAGHQVMQFDVEGLQWPKSSRKPA